MMRIGSILAAAVATLAALAQTLPQSQPATASAPTTTAASAPAKRLVRWHETYAAVAEEAKQRGVPLLVVYFDPTTPACEAFEQMTLSDEATREFLADFAACRLNVTQPAKQQRFAKTGAKETPLTQVLTPAGELLDELPGCIIPASMFRRRLARSLEYWQAVGSRPFDPAARWRAVQARLATSTRAEAVKDIDALLKLAKEKLPAGAPPPRLHLARGRALLADPARARKAFTRAMEAAPEDGDVAGEALLALARLDEAAGDVKAALERLSRYAKDFPDGPQLATACVRRAILQFHATNDAPAAIKTLEEFVRDHPDDAGVVWAKQLLESLRKLTGRTPAATRPADKKEPASQPRPARLGKQGGQT